MLKAFRVCLVNTRFANASCFFHNIYNEYLVTPLSRQRLCLAIGACFIRQIHRIGAPPSESVERRHGKKYRKSQDKQKSDLSTIWIFFIVTHFNISLLFVQYSDVYWGLILTALACCQVFSKLSPWLGINSYLCSKGVKILDASVVNLRPKAKNEFLVIRSATNKILVRLDGPLWKKVGKCIKWHCMVS